MTLFLKIIFSWTLILSLHKVWHAEEIASTEDENMCNKTVRYPVVTEISYNYTYMESYTTFCSSFPFICKNFRPKSRIEQKDIIEFRNQTILDCCEGYQKVAEETICKPVCDNGCTYGNCTAPNTCTCLDGWQGLKCSEECEEGKYGQNCFHICLCKNGAICDKRNGTCKCAPGFTGEYCESPCPKLSYGQQCENTCKCKNGAECDKANGTCSCKPGYYGKQCKYKCVEGTFGTECKGTCKCKMENTDICSHIDGKCFCKSGWRGSHCEKSCGDQTWGPSCLNSCECGRNGSCHRITGQCLCPPGWEGPDCDKKCPIGYYAKDCKMKCPDCRHEPGSCHHETGWCNCPPGTSGPTCDLECPNGTYGRNCENICLCTNNSICDSSSGECLCFPGWTGNECQFPCPEGTYGKNCNFSCSCPHRFSCNRFDGNCNCNDTDDDPLCRKGPFLLLNEATINRYYITGIFIIIGMLFLVLLIIFLGIYLMKRKKVAHDNTFSLCKSLRTFILRLKIKSSSKENEDVNSSNGKNFENPVYEVMNESLRSSHCAHSFDNPLAITNDDLDFKIPECDTSTKEKYIEHQSKYNKSGTVRTVEEISIESTVAKYEKKDVDQRNSKNSCQDSPVYTEVDLTEHHFEFPSRRMN